MHLKLQQLRLQVKTFRKIDSNVTLRLTALVELAKLEDKSGVHDLNYQIVAARFKKTPRTIYNWKRAYLKLGPNGLTNKGFRGKKAKHITGWTAQHIKEMRLNWNWGADVIQAHLKKYYKIELSKFKIHTFLKLRGLLNRKTRKIKTQKLHNRIVKVFQPGIHTQIDIKHLPRILKNGKKCYVYNFVDHASKWQFKMAFDSYGPGETELFMRALLNHVPFKIHRLQTDNGQEFTFKYVSHLDSPKEHVLDTICKELNIKKKLIPVGEKELNGLVERSHRQDDEEFYQTIRPANIIQFNEMLRKHCQWCNEWRLREPLGWISSREYLENWKKTLKQFTIFNENTEKNIKNVA